MQRNNRNGSMPIFPEPENPFRYGYRFVKKRLANGDVIEDRAPLTLQDVFFPQEGDELAHTPLHGKTILCLLHAISVALAKVAPVSMTFDTNTNFGVEDAPDVRSDLLALLDAHTFDKNKATIAIAETGAKTILAVEVTGPETRDFDLTTKVEYYRKGKVDIYLIVDYGPLGEDPPVLIGRRRVKGKWKMMKPDAKGLLDLDPFNVLIGTDNEELCFYRRENGELIPDVVEIERQRLEAEERLRKAQEERRKVAEKKHLKELHARIKKLKALLQQHGIPLPTE